MTDDLGSWDCQIDHALGQARRALEYATDAYVADPVDVDEATALAQAWRELASAWAARQTREYEWAPEDEPEDEETEDERTFLAKMRRKGDG